MAKRRHRRGRRKKNWFLRLSGPKKAAVCLGAMVLALLASGVVYAASKLNQIDTQEIPQENIVINQEAEAAGEGYTNVALFGGDSRTGELEKGVRTDTIIVASLNNKTKEIRMVSVYRDTLLDIGDGTLQKCNAAYSFGGPEQAINMLNRNLDLDIQKYVTVDFGIVADVIDLLGGVEIDVKEEEVQYINEFIDETGQVAGKEVNYVQSGGTQVLDGVQATTYARIRSTAGGDFTRTERQRTVIEKMVEKIKQSDLGTINSIIDEVLPTISTNFTSAEILSYAKDFAKYTLGENAGFPFDKTTDTVSGLGSIVIPVSLTSNVQQLHEFLYGTTDYTVSSEVSSISGAIVSRVGEREATDDETLRSQTYTVAPEDEAQESGSYTGGGNSGTGNNSGNSDANTGGGSGGGNGGANTGGGDNSGTGGGDNSGTGGGDSSGTGGGDNSGAGGGESGGDNGGTGGGDGETTEPPVDETVQ
ncbi:LytR family transcriptional regulator [Lachnospiraceae bacterium KGMB03038]|nr:LytR family transcriptional regulator [Lachnospiraceae bacterium KGMB03038]